MAEPLVDVDLDALAPIPKKVRLGGKVYRLPGDMPMVLFLKLQAFDQRVKAGADEMELLTEIQGELLTLFQVHNPTMRTLPAMGILQLAQALPAIYGGAEGEPPGPNRATRRQKKRTTSPPAKGSGRARATSR